jgi:hypothetical protein
VLSLVAIEAECGTLVSSSASMGAAQCIRLAVPRSTQFCAPGLIFFENPRPRRSADIARNMSTPRLRSGLGGVPGTGRSGEQDAVDGGVEDLGGVRGPQGDAPGRQLGRDLQGAARVGRDQQAASGASPATVTATVQRGASAALLTVPAP